MKKVISLLLSVLMLMSITIGSTITSYAEYDSIYTAYNYTFGELYSNYQSQTNQRDYLKFKVPCRGIITIDYYSEQNQNNIGICDPSYGLCDANGNDILREYTTYNNNTGLCYANKTINVSSGIYYFYNYCDYYLCNTNFNVRISFKAIIETPSSFKVSTRKTTSLKLSWNKVAGVSGYQLQQYKSNKWATIKTTSSNSYTVSGLKAGTTYKFRVRAYKTVDGKKYYSGWTSTLTTPTKPNTPTIKTPSTNRKHQITVKWKTVSSCSGYQVQYSKNSKFSSVIATKTVSGQSKTSYTGNNFTKGRKYYVRVRAYKTVNGKKYYSSWSKSKSIVSK